MQIINGKLNAEEIAKTLKQNIASLKQESGIVPTICTILVGNNPASKIYVENKINKAKSLGIEAKTYNLSEETKEEELIKLITKLNDDKNVNGILVQLPLPKHINSNKVINTITPLKDVDGLTIQNAGLLAQGSQKALVPCTALGCLYLIKTVKKDLKGLNGLVIGRSNLVGKPSATLLTYNNVTTTIAHSYTKNLKELCLQADIIIVAAGRQNLIDASYIKENAIVIDVGINRKQDGKITGDVNNENITKNIHISPVPKGVGPMTVIFLMVNTYKASLVQNGLENNTTLGNI